MVYTFQWNPQTPSFSVNIMKDEEHSKAHLCSYSLWSEVEKHAFYSLRDVINV